MKMFGFGNEFIKCFRLDCRSPMVQFHLSFRFDIEGREPGEESVEVEIGEIWGYAFGGDVRESFFEVVALREAVC